MKIVHKPCCPRCHHPEYKEEESSYDKRPEFTCTKCGNVWTCGLSGGPYVAGKFMKRV